MVTYGFIQVHKIHYIGTFALILRRKLLRIFLGITTLLRKIFLQMDVIGIYIKSLFGQNKYLIYIKIPPKCKIS